MNSSRSEVAPARQFKTGIRRSARSARIRPLGHSVLIAPQWIDDEHTRALPAIETVRFDSAPTRTVTKLRVANFN
jgi:hypothetical protein